MTLEVRWSDATAEGRRGENLDGHQLGDQYFAVKKVELYIALRELRYLSRGEILRQQTTVWSYNYKTLRSCYIYESMLGFFICTQPQHPREDFQLIPYPKSSNILGDAPQQLSYLFHNSTPDCETSITSLIFSDQGFSLYMVNHSLYRSRGGMSCFSPCLRQQLEPRQ